MNDIALDVLERAAVGNMDAFEEIYKATSSFVYNVALRVTHNNANAEEVTQDVFMKIYRNLKGFGFRSTFKTWVYRITVNTAINHYRKFSKEESSRVDYDNVIASLPDNRPEEIGRSDSQIQLNTLLDRLSPDHKTCLILREIEGLSYEEIAGALSIPVNTVRTRLKRARQALLAEAERKSHEPV
jgi:RNA polymerase sigma-70 factor, ECF subfamily